MLARAALLGQIEDWDTGLRAFGKVVALDPESADAWANMASLYIKVTMSGIGPDVAAARVDNAASRECR